MATQAEATAMLETLAAWEYFSDSKWRDRVTRIVNDVLRKLRNARSVPPNSRVALLCQLHGAQSGFSDSLPGNVMASLTAIIEAHAVLQKHATATRREVEHVSRAASSSIPESLRAELRTITETSSPYNSPSTSSRLLRGQVLSVIEDRASALKEFRTALSSGPELIKSLYLDMGAFTYGFPEPSADGKKVDICWHGGDASEDARVTILYSANVEFLRRYLARIIFYAATEPKLQLHFHVVAPEREALDFIREAKELARTIHGFSHRSSKLPALSWSSSSLPAGVGNPITYYACARYLVARQVMDKFGTDVWIQDVDLYPISPISDSYSELAEFDVVVAASTGINMLAPWRRYIANNVFFARSDKGRQFAASAADYIWAFLDQPNSWMLDQNALDWAVETARPATAIGNMRALNIALTQSGMNGAIES
ncbi:hypothetical protein QFZ30_001368 [Arthrobacter pascens]|uniref:hypothetical protein n=1 Tax=Arthrobacter pascens TaxID=1677 RepID=UPI002794F9DE|nr:hypothetical protein [Arthrobacter pascens]MDQ0677986.1 hypothetical protein [Arthrobacter pascens]